MSWGLLATARTRAAVAHNDSNDKLISKGSAPRTSRKHNWLFSSESSSRRLQVEHRIGGLAVLAPRLRCTYRRSFVRAALCVSRQKVEHHYQPPLPSSSAANGLTRALSASSTSTSAEAFVQSHLLSPVLGAVGIAPATLSLTGVFHNIRLRRPSLASTPFITTTHHADTIRTPPTRSPAHLYLLPAANWLCLSRERPFRLRPPGPLELRSPRTPPRRATTRPPWHSNPPMTS